MSETKAVEGYTEEEGIEAIKFLQGVVNIDEAYEQAKKGWDGMGRDNQKFTIDLYRRIKEKRKEKRR